MAVRGLIFLGVAVFYLIYLTKALLLKRNGITVNLLGSKKDKRERYFELVLRLMTGVGGAIQFLAPFLFKINKIRWVFLGMLLLYLGVLIFFIAVKTMGLNWRAGYNQEQKTELVTTGIYRFSRNPAFVGFDLLYIGMAVIFPNVLMILSAILSLVLFDSQIRGEEAYLRRTFGSDYHQYQKRVRRYF